MAKLRGTLSGVVVNPDSNYTPQGKFVLKFSLPAEQYKAGGKQTEWIRCVCWGDRYEKLTEYIVAGKIVTVTGEISLETWTGKDGTFHASLVMTVYEIDLLGSTQKLAQTQAKNKATDDPSQWDISAL